jgi:abortive infection bacteriophage resistance protein
LQYAKEPLSIAEQIERLVKRGLVVNDRKYAFDFLSRISYYRLRAYTYPYQNNHVEDHPFTTSISIEEVASLYEFDSCLRNLVLTAIEPIEIAFRTQVIHQWAASYGSHWHLNQDLFRDRSKFIAQLGNLQREIERSDEAFIKHYRYKYTSPIDPAVWMSLEVTSFGLLSLLFRNLKKGPEKINVIKYFRVADVRILENWMHCISNIRNICAHHARLWNRILTTHILIPKDPRMVFLHHKEFLPYKLYGVLSAILFLLNSIGFNEERKHNLMVFIGNTNPRFLHEMGFPDSWNKENLWQV